MSDALFYLSATQALALFKTGELSPVELADAVIRRSEAIAKTVNPFADRYFDEAMKGARKAEQRYTRRKTRTRRLEGLVLSVKDSFSIRGRRSTVGSLFNAESIDELTDPSIERLLRAGAILLARTTCPEFCWLYATHTRMWGITRNPWRLDTSPGGSSGGSAAALAAGATTLATGSDSTGSIRQPAAQCGVVGYQAPHGRFPMLGHQTFDPYINVGPMTRSVADAALMTNVMAGHHRLDHHSLPGKLRLPDNPLPIDGINIAFSMDLGHHEVDGDVARETHLAIDALRAAGATVDAIDVNWASEAIRLAHAHEEFLFAPVIVAALRDHPDLVCDYTTELAQTATSVTVDDYRASLEVAGRVWQDHLGPLFQRYDAFVCPTVSCPEVSAESTQKSPVLINGKSFTDTDTAMTALFNMYNRCPALAVPSGMTDAGLPTSLQIIARPHDDAMAFRVGSALERQRPWLDNPARRPVL